MKLAALAGMVAAAALLGSLTPATAQTAVPPPPPLELYGAEPALSSVEISPDGKRLAYLENVKGRLRLVVQDLSGKLVQQLDVTGAKVRGIDFAGPDHVLITTSTTTTLPLPGVVNKDELSQVQSLNLNTGKVVYLMNLTPGTTNIVTSGPYVRERDGKLDVYVGSYNLVDIGRNLYRVNLDTGLGRLVEKGGLQTTEFLLDPEGTVIAREEYDNDDKRWRLLVRQPRGWKEVINEAAPIDRPELMGLGRDGNSFVVQRKTGETMNLYEVSADGRMSAPLLQRTDFYTGPIFHPKTRRLVGVAYQEDWPEYVFFDPELERLFKTAKAPFKGKQAGLAGMSRDWRKLVIFTQGKGDPGTYYLADLDAKTAMEIGETRPDLPDAAVAEIKRADYTARDGTKIPAYLTLPPGRATAKGLPLIVMPHGGPAARDTPGFDWWSQALASRGYAVLQPQFRGSEGFGLKHLEAGYGQWGRKMQTDLSDGVRHLASQGVIDPKRVCIFGWSYGGYAALAGPTLDPGVYRCAVGGAPVSDLAAMVSWVNDNFGQNDNPAGRYWNRFMGDRSGWDAVSPARQAARADAPILLIHGSDDVVVPIRQSHIMEAALKKAGKPVEIVVLPKEDHWLSRPATRTRMLQEATAFLEKHNPPN